VPLHRLYPAASALSGARQVQPELQGCVARLPAEPAVVVVVRVWSPVTMTGIVVGVDAGEGWAKQ